MTTLLSLESSRRDDNACRGWVVPWGHRQPDGVEEARVPSVMCPIRQSSPGGDKKHQMVPSPRPHQYCLQHKSPGCSVLSPLMT